MMICMYCYGQLQIRCMHIILCTKPDLIPPGKFTDYDLGTCLFFAGVEPYSEQTLATLGKESQAAIRRKRPFPLALPACPWAILRCRLHLRYGEWCKHHATTAGCSSLARASKSSSYKASLTCEEDISGSSGPIRKKGVSGASSLRRSVYVGRPKAIKPIVLIHSPTSTFRISTRRPRHWGGIGTKSIHSQDCCKSQTTWLSFKWLTLSQEVSSVARRTSMARLCPFYDLFPFLMELIGNMAISV